ncbi:AI-2 transport protein TqsA [Roseimaritima multifibrata]|uniref:AI-2 transport protein TqsA n=2 Tax=Roseimaritima multifibrata TaxID=1930274 RepID=A0A517MG98_9BACT|nr:AI-2 transport protein TqsA [Roseimaritima multifibrata]
MSDSSNRLVGATDPSVNRRVSMERVRVRETDRERADDAPDRYLRASTTFIAAVLALGVLNIASDLFVPIVVALLAYLSLRPFVAMLCRHHIPQAAASGVVITGLFFTLGIVTSLLYSPAQQWMRAAPEDLVKVRDKFREIAPPLTAIDRADEVIGKATTPVHDGKAEVTVEVEKPSMVDESVLINQTGQWLAFIAAIAVLTFFMLSTGDDLLNRMLGVLPDASTRDDVLEKIADIQHSVGKYLAQITCINIGLGIAVTLVMWLLGMPTPVLWGVIATLFNFIPYVGPLAATVIVFLAASSSFDTIGRAILIALAFWLTTAVEGQFITPSILGKTLKAGPVVVLIAVAFWGFLWGLPGVFLAVPLLIVQRKVLASFSATYPLAAVLGEDPCRPDEVCEPVKEDQPIAELA